MTHEHLISWRAIADTASKPRPTVSRLRRRVLRTVKRCATLALYGASFVAGAIVMLIFVQEALRAPLTTFDSNDAPAVVVPAPKNGTGA